MSFVWTQFECQIVLFDLYIGPYQMLRLWVRVDQGSMKIMEYSTFSKAPGSEPHNQIVLCHIQDIHQRVLPLCKDAVGVFYCPSWLDCFIVETILCSQKKIDWCYIFTFNTSQNADNWHMHKDIFLPSKNYFLLKSSKYFIYSQGKCSLTGNLRVYQKYFCF